MVSFFILWKCQRDMKPDTFKSGKIDFIQTTTVEERDFNTEPSSTPLKCFKYWSVLKGNYWNRLRGVVNEIRPAGFVNCPYLEEKQLYIFRTGGSFANWSKAPTKIKLFLSYWETGELSPCLFAFQRDGPRSLRRHFRVVKDLCLKWKEKRFIIVSFLK